LIQPYDSSTHDEHHLVIIKNFFMLIYHILSIHVFAHQYTNQDDLAFWAYLK